MNATEESSWQKHFEGKCKQEGRTLHKEWKKAFVWLQFDENKQEMFCKVCMLRMVFLGGTLVTKDCCVFVKVIMYMYSIFNHSFICSGYYPKV